MLQRKIKTKNMFFVVYWFTEPRVKFLNCLNIRINLLPTEKPPGNCGNKSVKYYSQVKTISGTFVIKTTSTSCL